MRFFGKSGLGAPGLALLSLALAGCMAAESPPAASPSAEDPCPAADLGALVGRHVSAADQVPDPKRVIRPGDAVTLDYNPERTNIELDSRDVIAALTCG